MKRLISTVTLFAFTLSPLMADQAPVAAPQEQTAPPAVTPETPPDVKEVQKEDQATSSKNSRWVDFAIAAGAIAVAIGALFLVKNNRGHKHHDKKDK
ncbi:MAG: hypothetical protein JSR58_07355 [Verrucomicrobia bacterium]|nr:hypothetical protein [Verrucomicrobiota bacterium]